MAQWIPIDYIPALEALGIDADINAPAALTKSTKEGAELLNGMYDTLTYRPTTGSTAVKFRFNEEVVKRYIVDRVEAGAPFIGELLADAGETLPVAIKRPGKPALNLAGSTLSVTSPITNYPATASQTRVRVYVDRQLVLDTNANLTIAGQRQINLSSLGVTVTDQNFYIALIPLEDDIINGFDAGVCGWFGHIQAGV